MTAQPSEASRRPADPAELRAEMARQDAVRARLRRRPGLQTILMLAIGAVFGAAATLTWQVHPTGRSVTGVLAAIDDTGSAIAMAEPADLADVGFGVVGVLWREAPPPGGAAGDPAERWRRTLSDEGYPTCLAPGDEGRAVTLGLITDPGGVDRPASEVVAWLECGPRPPGG